MKLPKKVKMPKKVKDLINYQVAVYFLREDNESLPFPIFIPNRYLFGHLDKENEVFTETSTGETYLSTAISYDNKLIDGFNLSQSVVSLKVHYPRLSIDKILKMTWSELERYVFTYNEEGKFVAFEQKDFEERFNVDLNIITTEELNQINKAIVDKDEETLEILNEENNDEETIDEGITISMPISEMVNNIKKDIIAQDEAIKTIVTAIYKNLYFENATMKSNILMYGPTGTGKTALIKSLAKNFDVPVWIEDMTRFTESGYKGENVDDILINLYHNADEDIERAEKSIVYLDEIDKKANKGDSDRSFNKDDVLKNLLKIIEGGVFNIEVNHYEKVEFDTSKLTIIVGGAFTDLYKTKVIKSIGFNSEIKKEEKKEITTKDFDDYGLPREFLGRFKTIVRLNALTKEDLLNILKYSDLSALKNYINEYKNKGTEIVIPALVYDKIAEKAIENGTGARALNLIVDKIFEKANYEFFDNLDDINNSNIKVIELNEDILENNKSYKLIKKER